MTAECAVVPAYADRIVLPAPDGDAEAARMLAAAFRRAADAVERERRSATAAVAGLNGAWSGSGKAASANPWQRLDAGAVQAVAGLRQTATALDRYADALEEAHRRHRWSWQKIAAVGLTVAVVAGAVVVTGGALLPAGSVAAGEVAGGIAAAEGATVLAAEAAAGAGVALAETSALAAAVQGLAALALPHLAMGVVSGGADLLVQEIRGGEIDWGSVGVSFGVGTVGSVGTTAALGRVAALKGLSPAGRFLATHLTVGGIAAGSDATAQAFLNGSVDWSRAAEAGGAAFLISGGTDLTLRGFRAIRPTTRGVDIPPRVTPDRRVHILDGDATGGGHRFGTGLGKSEFPASWSDERIIATIEDVANDPHALVRRGRWGRYEVIGRRDGIDILVVVENPFAGGTIVTGYPLEQP